VLFGWVAARATRPISDPDDWWHLRLGNDLIAQRSLAAPQHWSAFATVSWVPTEPVPEIVAAYLDRWFGLPGLAVLYDVAGAAVVLTVYFICRRRSDPLPAAVATVLVVLTAAPSLTSRPQLVSFVLFPVVLDAWLRAERDHRVRWWLLPLFWAWSLCHGFWFIGAGYGVLFVVGFALSRTMGVETIVRHVLVAAGSFAVVALNPVGLGVLEAPFRVNDTSRYIEEWARTDLTSLAAIGGLAMVVGTCLIWTITRHGATWPRALVLVSALFWIWYAGRTVALGGLVTAPLLAEALSHLVRGAGGGELSDTERPLRRERLLVGVAAAVAAVTVAVAAPYTADSPGDVPTALDRHLDQFSPGARIFNAYELGGWLAWRHPDLEQYIDGLITPYSPQHAQDYTDVVDLSPGWRRIFERGRFDAVLIRDGSRLALALRREGWRDEGHSEGYVLLGPPAFN
jgi:hypothetical protein